MKNLLTAIVIFSSVICFLPSCKNENAPAMKKEEPVPMPPASEPDTKDMSKMNDEMMKSMQGSMSKMMDMKMTGDFDLDFATMMIMHHQAAIDMSTVQLTRGTDAQIRSMSQNIITAQKAEIAQMQQFVSNHKMSDSKHEHGEMHNELAETMKMMQDTMMSMHMSGNPDKDYVVMMIPHHESAITMAEEELEHGKSLEMKKLAQSIIISQKKEIMDFTTWFTRNK
ncbi:MAG: DUF305 domain-containing protein [Saprospiraceae bacterium]